MEFEIPETVDDLDLDTLARLETEAVEAFDELRDDPELTAEGVARLRAAEAAASQSEVTPTDPAPPLDTGQASCGSTAAV